MNKKAFIFPGQGSQFVGMGKDIYQNNTELRYLFDTANEILGFNLINIIFDGPEKELKKTENTQPALFLINALFLQLARDKGYEADFVAGHSLGEYSALYSAGAISFKDGLLLVRKRGELMEKAASNGIGRMAAIIGLEREKMEIICSECSDNNQVVEVANINAPLQIVISGHKTKVELAVSKAKESGAKKTIMLDVSGPFHSSLMEPAKNKFKEIINNINFKDLKMPIITNVEARLVVDGNEAKEMLIEQLTRPVEWVDSIKKIVNNSVTVFYEIGPGKVLRGLVKRINSEVKIYSFEEIINNNKAIA